MKEFRVWSFRFKFKIKYILRISCLLLLSTSVFPQSNGVGINTTGAAADKSAMLDVSATGRGILIPRMSTVDRPLNPVESLMIFNTDTKCFETYNAQTLQWVNIACIGSGCPGFPTVTDVEGNSYNTIQIGSQCWMKENLKTTKYKNNTAITNVTDSTTWVTSTTEAYCWYNNDAATFKNIYGALYNWYAVNDVNGICPTGWHVPSHDEWTTLEKAVCSSATCATDFPNDIITIGFRGTDEGGKLKEAGTTHWTTPNTGATNSSGFSALPGGYRESNNLYLSIGNNGLWWTATESSTHDGAWYRLLTNTNSNINRNFSYVKQAGLSVRCLKD